MTIKDLIKLYEKKKEQFGKDAHRHVSNLLNEAKAIHKKDFLGSATAKRALVEGRQPDHEQSWRAFKGKNLENSLFI